MTSEKPGLGNSSFIPLRRSKRLQLGNRQKEKFGITFSRRRLVDKKEETPCSTKATSTTFIKKLKPPELGNEDKSYEQANHSTNTTTSKGKSIVNNPEEMLDPIWRGSLSINDRNFSRVDGLVAYNSTKACPEVLKIVRDLPALLHSKLLPSLCVWPKIFSSSPTERENKAFSSLLDSLTDQDLVMKIVFHDTILLVSSSRQLPHQYWRKLDKYYLWAVLVGTNPFFPCQEGEPSFICSIESILSPNSENDAEAALRHERSLKNSVLEDYGNEPDQILVEGLDPFERARNEGLTEMGTSTILANNFVEPNVFPDPNLEEAERVHRVVKCSEVPQAIAIDSGLAPAFLRPHEDLNTPNAEGTFMSTRNPNQENVRSADSSSRQRQSIIDEPLRNSAFQGKAICTASICTSVLNMAQHFDDDTYEETTSVDNIGERVAQYKVKPNFAHTLRAIIEKHGDIAKDCLLRSPEMLTSVLEKVCQVVQDIQALELKNLRQNHMNSLQLAILDAELVKVDVKWLKNCHNELKVAVDHIKRYKSLVLSKRRNIEAIESKKTELMKLKS